ncbi:MAG: glycosyltransferase, partial [Candidatus Limnocylindria bacterium]
MLVASGLLAWFAITSTLAARLLQAGVGLSLLYVAYLAWRGWRAMRAAVRGGSQASRHPARPWVTVIVPAANEAGVVGGCLRDLAAQDYADASGPRFDVLLVDDGSEDETGDVAREAAARLVAGGKDRVRIVRREREAGPRTKAAVLAFAQPLAGGEVTAVIDADTRLDR